jgi:hypothetical protein
MIASGQRAAYRKQRRDHRGQHRILENTCNTHRSDLPPDVSVASFAAAPKFECCAALVTLPQRADPSQWRMRDTRLNYMTRRMAAMQLLAECSIRLKDLGLPA